MVLYASNTNKLAETQFHEIPFKSAKIQYRRNEASTLSFTTTENLKQGTRVKYVDPNGELHSFGGQIFKQSEKTNSFYDYEAVSYHRIYLSKNKSVNFSNMTSSQIINKLLKDSPNHLSTAGITSTKLRHSYLKWDKSSIWEIAQNLVWLEWKSGNAIECLVDSDGVLRFGKNINTSQSYIFSLNNNNILDYNDEYSTEDVTTVGRVIFNGSTKAQAVASKELIAVWGYIEDEPVDCTETVTKNSTANVSIGASGTAQQYISKYNIDNKIVQQAQSIVGSTSSDKDKAKKIFNWMRSNIKYSYYACTKRGAKKTLSDRKGNCADQTHLYMSLAYSVGLKARCNHISGHFFPETMINGKWFITDTTTSRGWGNHWGNGGHIAYYDNPNKFNC